MNNRQNIEKLIYIHDLNVLGVVTPLTDSLKSAKINQSLIEKYSPPFLMRCSMLAWDYCFLEFKKDNPTNATEKFKTQYWGTKEGLEKYNKALNAVATLIPKDISVESLKELQKK